MSFAFLNSSKWQLKPTEKAQALDLSNFQPQTYQVKRTS